MELNKYHRCFPENKTIWIIACGKQFKFFWYYEKRLKCLMIRLSFLCIWGNCCRGETLPSLFRSCHGCGNRRVRFVVRGHRSTLIRRRDVIFTSYDFGRRKFRLNISRYRVVCDEYHEYKKEQYLRILFLYFGRDHEFDVPVIAQIDRRNDLNLTLISIIYLFNYYPIFLQLIFLFLKKYAYNEYISTCLLLLDLNGISKDHSHFQGRVVVFDNDPIERKFQRRERDFGEGICVFFLSSQKHDIFFGDEVYWIVISLHFQQNICRIGFL